MRRSARIGPKKKASGAENRSAPPQVSPKHISRGLALVEAQTAAKAITAGHLANAVRVGVPRAQRVVDPVLSSRPDDLLQAPQLLLRVVQRCGRSLIAHAITAIRNWNVAGNFFGHLALSRLSFQAPYLFAFVPEFPRRSCGHHGVRNCDFGVGGGRVLWASQHTPSRFGLEEDMKTHLDCIPCFLRQTIEAAHQISTDARVHEHIVREVLRMGAELELDLPPPLVGQRIRRRLRELTGVRDPYQSAKSRFNRLAMDALSEIAVIVKRSSEPLLAAARFAIAANAIDMGVSAELTDADVREALLGSADAPFRGDEQKFQNAVADARRILYLADNAGEIAIDRLLIEQLGPERVTLAVRGAPVLNDATLVDAHEVGLHELVEVIDNGSDVAGTFLEECSLRFQQRFHGADLVIAKGQGNFETLSDVASNTFFLFKVKCPVLSRHVGFPLGTHTLLHQGSQRETS